MNEQDHAGTHHPNGVAPLREHVAVGDRGNVYPVMGGDGPPWFPTADEDDNLCNAELTDLVRIRPGFYSGTVTAVKIVLSAAEARKRYA